MRDQADKRDGERSARRSAVAVTRWASWSGIALGEVAELIGLSPATLREWNERWGSDHLTSKPRGAPVPQLDRQQRNELIAILHQVGPSISHRAFVELAPFEIPRREVERFLDRYRHICDRRYGQACFHALRWHRPGSVWAMDFTEPDTAVEGRYRTLLVVRDLSSGFQLAALPCANEEAFQVVACLRGLFAAHGAPLVIKSDNGPAFIAESTQDLLRAHRITWLASPPYTPSYNGACEAGNGSIKTRAHHQAARNDRPEQWTCDDIEYARCEANHLGRPRGKLGPSPQEVWATRTPITYTDRIIFEHTLVKLRAERLEEWRRDTDAPPDAQPDKATASTLEREAISRSLFACNYLTTRRRRITLPNWRRKVRGIA